jgi:hypothetical protein
MQMTTVKRDKKDINEAISKNIAHAVDGLEYGTIMIKVHDAKIIQVEITQKKRFDDIWFMGEGGGI